MERKKNNLGSKYIVGYIVNGIKGKEFCLLKKRFSKAFRNMVKIYLEENLYFQQSNNDIDKICFEISLYGIDCLDFEKKAKELYENHIKNIAGIGY